MRSVYALAVVYHKPECGCSSRPGRTRRSSPPPAAALGGAGAQAKLATGESLLAFARQHGLRIGTIAGLIQFRLINETTVHRIREGEVQTAFGSFRLHAFRDADDAHVHVALARGLIDPETPTLAAGLNVAVAVPTGAARAGVVVPEGAVVRWSGVRWVYRASGAGHFERVALADAQPVEGGLFVTTGLAAGEEIAVAGAAVLLSQELIDLGLAAPGGEE